METTINPLDGLVVQITNDSYLLRDGAVYDTVFDGLCQVEVLDGIIYCPDTGELIGTATPVSLIAEDRGGMSESHANWVMGKILRHDSRAASAQIARDKAKAVAIQIINEAIETATSAARMTPEYIEAQSIIDNSDKVANEATKAADFFRKAYEVPLVAYAKMQVGTGKAKNWKTPYGTIQWRTKPPKLTVGEGDSLVEWAERQGYTDAINKSFLISGVPKDEKASLLADEARANAIGFLVIPGTEDVEIVTNVGGVNG